MMELPIYRRKTKVRFKDNKAMPDKEYVVDKIHPDRTGYWYSLEGHAPVFHESELKAAQ